VLACARVWDSTVTLGCATLVPDFLRKTATIARELAGRQGFEPRYRGPEPRVLPLDDLPVPAAARGEARTVDYSQSFPGGPKADPPYAASDTGLSRNDRVTSARGRSSDRRVT